ncbi:MAG: hypothetical protein LBQ95_03020 [Lachnospiraceae bacterium]|nr:hypothetical protein [Lachnospiraceae bacterium]
MAQYSNLKKKALGLPASEETDDIFAVPQTARTSLIPHTSLSDLLDISSIRLAELKKEMQEFPEYTIDRKSSDQLLKELINALNSNNATEITSLLDSHPAAEWLSRAFLDDEEISPLLQSINNADKSAKNAFAIGIKKQLERLVTFKSLFEALLKEVEA